jgi:hypothetical protein
MQLAAAIAHERNQVDHAIRSGIAVAIESPTTGKTYRIVGVLDGLIVRVVEEGADAASTRPIHLRADPHSPFWASVMSCLRLPRHRLFQ